MPTAPDSLLVVEDGTMPAGANTLASPSAAADYHLCRGNLTLAYRLESASVAFSVGGLVTLPAGEAAGLTLPALARVSGSAGNDGWAYAVEASGDDLVVAWLATATEAAGASVVVEVFAQSGWWAASLWALEASLVAATDHLGLRYPWVGERLGGLAWPRRYAYVQEDGPHYESGDLLGEDVVADGVPQATARWALVHLSDPLDQHQARDERPLISKTIPGAISKTWADPHSTLIQGPSDAVADLELRGLLRLDASGAGTAERWT